jgi:hypothetical protein
VTRQRDRVTVPVADGLTKVAGAGGLPGDGGPGGAGRWPVRVAACLVWVAGADGQCGRLVRAMRWRARRWHVRSGGQRHEI